MRRETGTYWSPGPRRSYREHSGCPSIHPKSRQPAESSEGSPLAKLPTWVASEVPSSRPQEAGRRSHPSHLPTLGLPLLISPMATLCLSAGITLTNSFTRFPQKSASCPFCACSQTSAKSSQPGRSRNPGQESSGQRKRGFPRPSLSWSVMHLANPALQRPEQHPGIPCR